MSEDSAGRVLIVDDEKLTLQTLEAELAMEGYEVVAVDNPFAALERLAEADYDVVLSDLRMPSMDGIELQRRISEGWPGTEVLFMTAFGTVDSAVAAMRQGAADYLSKPLNTPELLIRLERAVARRRERVQFEKLRLDARSRRLAGVVWQSAAMQRVVDRALSAAATDVALLLEGETGTGKEVFARMIHEHSPYASGPLIIVNCAGLNANLVESELFGHEAGAFTGATKTRKGRVELADGGTLMIDEVDDLPVQVQVSLLRFLQDGSFERVGDSRTRRSKARIVCATKRPLLELVEAGSFRRDLYYRIDTVRIVLPPLRERPDDILPLAENFLRAAWRDRGYDSQPRLTAAAARRLCEHSWPGNVRELQHAMEHAAVFARGAEVTVEQLPASLVATEGQGVVALNLRGHDAVDMAEVMGSCERQLLDWALARSGGNQAAAAAMLGIPRTTLRSRLEALRRQGS